ncbi:ATP-binding protein [Streptomyces sp. NPDC001315]|uniref:ATP-binding protein n=1 Tax=Streptomyces sp. NPDC001315 TaxID=3364562 RepID=UPI003679C859
MNIAQPSGVDARTPSASRPTASERLRDFGTPEITPHVAVADRQRRKGEDTELLRELDGVIAAPEEQKSVTLAANDRAPGTARSFTRDVLTAWGAEDLVERSVLIVSELTTNAERHGRSAREAVSLPGAGGTRNITLTLALRADAVSIEVEDSSPKLPIPAVSFNPYSTSGRGLCLVSYAADVWVALPKEDGSGKRVLALVQRL